MRSVPMWGGRNEQKVPAATEGAVDVVFCKAAARTPYSTDCHGMDANHLVNDTELLVRVTPLLLAPLLLLRRQVGAAVGRGRCAPWPARRWPRSPRARRVAPS